MTIHIIKDSAIGAAALAAGMVIDEKALVPLGTAAAAAGLIFWIGRKIQKIDDRFEGLEIGQDRLSAELKEGQRVLHKRLSGLPCERLVACNDEQLRKERE